MTPPENRPAYRSLQDILQRLLQSRPDAPIAITQAGQDFSVLDLSIQAFALKQKVLVDGDESEKWGMFTTSTINGLIAIVGLLWADKQPVLLPNTRDSVVRDVAPLVGGFITDDPDFTGDGPIIRLEDPHPTTNPQKPAQDFSFTSDACLQLFTSGSTGQPDMITKSLRALEAEHYAFERAFSPLTGKAPVMSTVTHQHVYGLTFRLLWPLSTGMVVLDGMLHFPHEVTAMLQKYPQACLISSPAFLKRAGRLVEYAKGNTRKNVVFSSGGPLPAVTSNQLKDTGCVIPIEIFGSTETGAIAFREQAPEKANTPWIPLPDVQTRVRDGLLEVMAPHLETPDWWTTQDRVELEDSHFVLKGRADRIAKIEEKRVHLGDQENFLVGSPLVDEAHIFMLEDGKAQLCAVVVPSEDGWQSLAKDGRNKFCRSLQHHLADRFEAVTHPRKWHFIKQMPLNTQGKRQLQTLTAYFARPDVPPDIPNVITSHIDEDGKSASLELFVPPTLPALQGHFPERAIVAGVVQISWSDYFARQMFKLPETAHKMDRIKFKHLLIPGTHCHMQIKWDPATHIATYDITGDGHIFAEGRLHYTEGDA